MIKKSTFMLIYTSFITLSETKQHLEIIIYPACSIDCKAVFWTLFDVLWCRMNCFIWKDYPRARSAHFHWEYSKKESNWSSGIPWEAELLLWLTCFPGVHSSSLWGCAVDLWNDNHTNMQACLQISSWSPLRS